MKFLADRTLGKLAKGLRMLGYDTVYYRGEDRRGLLHLARTQGRVILTRNTKLLPGRPEDRIILVQEDKPALQLCELMSKQFLSPGGEDPFSRCLLCNAVLETAAPKEVEGSVPDYIFHHQKQFFRCPECRRIYWPGSHQQNMRKRVKELIED
jgi:uncharacterized protein with PIN domain